MRSLLSASLSTVLLLAAAVGAIRVQVETKGTKFASVQEEAADFAGLGVPEYIQRLEEALRHAPENQELLQHLNYYRILNDNGALKQSVRDAAHGTVHDCVPFELQPALFEASAKEVHEARALWLSATNGGQIDTSVAVCPAATVAINRPVVKYGSDAFPRLRTATKKKNRPAAVGKKGKLPDQGYSYVDSAFANVHPDLTDWTYSVLGVGSKVGANLPTAPHVPNNNSVSWDDHSINQLWWLQAQQWNNPQSGFDVSLETGWIHCDYWSFFPTTSIFIFSTPNGYMGEHGNRYNTAGGFILYPGNAPAPAQDLTDIQYMFNYSKIEGDRGYKLELMPFRRSSRGIFYVFDTAIPYGHWPMERYLKYGFQKVPKFNVFQTGQEIDQGKNSSKLTAAGKIFGWGTNTEKFPIRGNFSAIGLFSSIPFHYGNFPTFGIDNTNPYTQPEYVHFNGQLCGEYCNKTGTLLAGEGKK